MHNLPKLVKTVWGYYDQHGRHDMPWRQLQADGSLDPYHVLVSEIMLQQTQVQRVTPKYLEFLQSFPTVQALAQAPLSEVLAHWSGLGYNRRAKFLWQAANMVVDEYGSVFPHEHAQLVRLPGVGPNTAGALMVYAYDAPVTFIETNVRSVFIQHCFTKADAVTDKQLLPFIEVASQLAIRDDCQTHTSRTWYWALMDYGSYLKRTFGNAASQSKSYAKQSRFEGSKRQVRGKVLRLLASREQPLDFLQKTICDDRLSQVLKDLQAEELITNQQGVYRLGGA